MEIGELEKDLGKAYKRISSEVSELRPAQTKAVEEGIFSGKSLLICTPTASGKTLVAEFASVYTILKKGKKAVYIVPLKALASEKYKHFSERYKGLFKVSLSVGDLDSEDSYLAGSDLIICTSEKLDSVMRHHAPWVSEIGCVVIDEIHLLNDPGRGPTLEILITLLKKILKGIQIIGLSATIGNASQLASWLDAKLVEDTWRPVTLHKAVCLDGEVKFK